MEFLPNPEEPRIKSTSRNLLRDISPYLRSADQQRHVKGLIDEELCRYEAEAVRDPIGGLALSVVTILGLVAGFAVGSW
ncbi:MAG: hypothetical protein AAFO01_14250 [Pseudomonadota bacterium]